MGHAGDLDAAHGRRATRCSGETELHEGDKVIMFYNSANRDEDVFDDPYSFDVRRSPNPHIGFGAAGPHFCLGAHLARQEIDVMFRRLFERLPDIAASSEPDRLLSPFINGIKHLECTFSPAAAGTLSRWRRFFLRLDALQRRRPVTAVPVAVAKKYGDDRGGSLAALVAFYGFLAVFPLLLLFVTVAGIVLGNDPAAEERIVHSALSEFPVVGDKLAENISAAAPGEPDRLRGQLHRPVVGVARRDQPPATSQRHHVGRPT